MSQSQSQSNVVVEVADRVTPELEQAFAKLCPSSRRRASCRRANSLTR